MEKLGHINLTVFDDDIVMESSFDDPAVINYFIDLFKITFLQAALDTAENGIC